jgi:DNA primase
MQDYFSLGYALPGETTIQLLRNKGHSIDDLDKAGLIMRNGTSFLDRFSNRITFPIYNDYGDVVAFSARRINDNDNPKYLLSPTNDIFNKSDIMYNYFNASKEARKVGYIYLCEGFMDVFAMYQAGEKASVALMGVALTTQNAKKLKRLNVEVRLCLDGDNAGQEGELDMFEKLEQAEIPYRIVNYKDSTLDPDEILQKYGKEVLAKFLNRLISKEEFLINHFKKRIDISTMDGKKAFIKALIPYGNEMKSEVDKEFFAKRVSEVTGLSEKVFLSQLTHELKIENMDFTPINNYSNAMKKMLPKSGIERLQSEAIYQMLTNENAIEIYVNGSYRFYDKQMDDLCNYLIDYYDKKNPLDASSFISYLAENAGEEKSKLINVVTELIATSHPPFNEESMKEMLDILKEKVDKITKSNKLTRKMQGKTPEEQAQIVQKDIIDANKDKKGD